MRKQERLTQVGDRVRVDPCHPRHPKRSGTVYAILPTLRLVVIDPDPGAGADFICVPERYVHLKRGINSHVALPPQSRTVAS